jgi:hypothetical protein
VLKFLITLSLVTLFILALAFWGMEALPAYFYHTLIFLFLATAGLYRFLIKINEEQPHHFVQLYLLTLVMKLMASSVYLFMIVKSEPEPAQDVVFFLAVYFVFTALEIGFLYGRIIR